MRLKCIEENLDPKQIHIVLKDIGDYLWLEHMKDSNDLRLGFGTTNMHIYGVSIQFPGCKWNKNYEETKDEQWSYEQLRDYRNKMEALGLRVIIMFDREDLKPIDMKDEYCRELLRIFLRGRLRHIVCYKHFRIRNLIRRRHPKLQLMTSMRNIKIYNMFIINENLNVKYAYNEEFKELNHEGLLNFIFDFMSLPYLYKSPTTFIEPVL